MATAKQRVLVTGGGTFLGNYIAAALLAEGAEVSLLVRPGAEDRLVGPLAHRTRQWAADVWNPASLRGHARGQDSVIHTVGSLNADTAQGLNYQWLNFASARNVANMCVGDGCSRLVLMSASRAPWVNSQYIRAKREAETYIERVGLQPVIIRAPVVYARGQRRHPFFWLMTLLGSVPPTMWLGFGRMAPLPVDMLARGVARLALKPEPGVTIYYRRDLKRRNSREEARGVAPQIDTSDQTLERTIDLLDLVDEDTPFGWSPPDRDD